MRLIDADKIPFSQSEDGCLNDVAYRYDINEMPTIEPTSIAPPSNDPLTLDELREMDGEPVWLEIAGGVWGLVDIDDNVVWLDRGGSLCLVDIVGLAYRRKPEEG